ncbi:Prefoldin alpha subunit [Fomitiporia mediterranea MF3/22]|uniref:Prefoldin alpha subunit n=1 Tax=Fomitiporia mediterranea (strain MF3/22) TaxID=694068 RepID=UPI00044089E4|nr:Prefoldin alpha subunit [Fomitiporia mediterranea MF3/22]EJD01873.1 Prefoldin alpha subunit [Fomitiporia mediterranea MF3/22]
MSGPQPQQQQMVNVADLDVSQLRDVRRQLEEELTHLTASFQQLKLAQAKFRTCLSNVTEVNSANAERKILVPLTNSLYVPGKLSDLEHVIVDVGTGYYVKKSRADAAKHYTVKIDFVKGNIETLQEALTKKQDNFQYVMNLIAVKEQTQQGAVSGAS